MVNYFHVCQQLICILCRSQNEREEFEMEFKQKYEREKILLTEENKKLSSELDKVSVMQRSDDWNILRNTMWKFLTIET